MSNLNERLKQIRKTKDLTQQELGNILSVSKQAVANIESGHNKPSIEFISKLIENLNINSNWFLIGKGNMFNAPELEEVHDELTLKVEAILRKNGLMK